MVKGINTLRTSVERKKVEEKPEAAPPPEDVKLLTEIRDLLKTR